MLVQTFGSLRHTLRTHKAAVALVIGGSIIAGGLGTAKSLIESAIISNIAGAIDRHESDHIWSTRLPPFSGSGDDDWVTRASRQLLGELTVGGAIPVYLIVSVVAVAVGVITATCRSALSRSLFADLHARGLEAAFKRSETSTLSEREPGGLAGAIQQGAQAISATYSFVIEAAQYLFSLVAVVLILFRINALFALFALAVTLLLAGVSVVQARHLEKRRKSYDEIRRDLFGFTDDVLTNRDMLLANEQAPKYVGELKRTALNLAGVSKALTTREGVYRGAATLLQDAGQIGILVLAAVVASQGADLSQVGETYFYVSIFARLMAPIRGLLSGYDDVKDSTATSDTLLRLLTEPPDSRSDSSVGGFDPESDPAVVLRSVSYAYDEKGSGIAETSLSLPRRGVTLLVGRSGSGKTTIARLILGFLAPQPAGSVEVLGRDVREWDQVELLRHISYLTQTGHVISGTVEANLFAQPAAEAVELEDALIRAGLAGSPDAATSMLARQATELSEGQRQRLALARIFLDRSPIVILDEPLAGVDAFTFSEVRKPLDDWLTSGDRTVLLITHRLAFASSATHVVLLEQGGTVLEAGEPRSLAADPQSRFGQLLSTAQAEFRLGPPVG